MRNWNRVCDGRHKERQFYEVILELHSVRTNFHQNTNMDSCCYIQGPKSFFTILNLTFKGTYEDFLSRLVLLYAIFKPAELKQTFPFLCFQGENRVRAPCSPDIIAPGIC